MDGVVNEGWSLGVEALLHGNQWQVHHSTSRAYTSWPMMASQAILINVQKAIGSIRPKLDFCWGLRQR